jgi:outer membrane protein assembly factor BamB
VTEKVKDENPARKPTGKPASKAAKKAPAKKAPAKKAAEKPPEEPTSKESPAKAAKATKAARDSGTAAAAAHARGVMQRRHRRLGFAMTTAMGVELAGAAGVVIGALLPWEWGEPLVGRTDTPQVIITQVLLGLSLLALLLAWVLRTDRFRVQARVAAAVLAIFGVAFAAALTWRAEYGSRGAGGLVATVGAVLVIAGLVTWLISLRRLRVLFPFGLADASRTGYGNLPAVRRAQLIGGPVGAVGGAAVVAGALLIFPTWVTTVDSETASSIALTGAAPAAGGPPAWQIELPASAREERSSTVHATPAGPVVEELRGVRGIDARTGEERWHWRDEAYQRAASTVTDGGATVVLALTYDGDDAGRDRVVALDTATGELRWDRYDDELVAAMSTVVVAPDQGDWFVVPRQGTPPADAAQAAPVSLLLIGADDGRTRWEAAEAENCRFSNVVADDTGMVVTTQECTVAEDGSSECRVAGLDPAAGTQAWIWPPADAEPAAGCQTSGTAELLFITHDAGEPSADGSAPPTATVALDPRTGAQVWLAGPDQEGGSRGFTNPAVVGDAVIGTEFADDGQGGGHGVMVIRNAADGTLRSEVDLPAGQPIDIAPAGDALAVVPIYVPATGAISLVEFDVAAGAVRSESPVSANPPETATIQWLAVAVGPESLTVDTLVATGDPAGTPTYVLRVAGW